jgi:ribosomal protein S18 acetylase RimI-like enzyme
MDEVLVRQVQPGDWATLREVRLAALAEAPHAFASTLAREQAFDEAEWRRRTGTSFIAWAGETPVGLVSVIEHAGGADRDPARSWALVSMWVRPDARGTGAADALVSCSAAAARAAGGDRLVLWVADDNARGRAFYRRCGFRPTGRHQVYQRDDGTSFGEQELALDLPGPGRA